MNPHRETREPRPLFVFQHGLGADAAQPASLVPDDAPFRVATFECPGHGDRAPSSAPSIASFASDVAAFAFSEQCATQAAATPTNAKQRWPWVLGGISMGAAISLRLACRGFDDTAAPAALVLVRPAWSFEPAPANMAPFIELADLLRLHGPAQGKARFARSGSLAEVRAISTDNADSLLAQFHRRQAIADPQATAVMLTSIARDGPGITEDEVRALSLPVLVIGCADDYVHPIAVARELADTIAGARFVEVASKSCAPVQHVEEVRRAIGEFLDGVHERG